METQGAQLIFGLVFGVFLLLVLVIKTKIHPFIALIISATVTGLISGLTPSSVSGTIIEGFGKTLGSIGIVIGFGVMMGRLLEVSGASERLAYSFIKALGKRKEEWAMSITGYIVSIPVFVDSAFVILTPILKAISKRTGKSIISIGVALGIGLLVTHSMVPPTPGPLGVAGIFNIDIGQMIFWGMLLSFPLMIIGVFYAKWAGTKVYQLPDDEGTGWVRPDVPKTLDELIELEESKNLPSLLNSIMPIFLPIVLIFMNTLVQALGVEGKVAEYLQLLGNPIIAVAIGLIYAIYTLTGHLSQEETLDRMEEGIQDAGIILLITGAGGALGHILTVSGSGDYIANAIATTSIPLVLLPFAIATMLKLVQGSGTVAMITSASISAPILSGLDVNMVLAALAATAGTFGVSYFNDSLFWVVNRMLGIKKINEQLLIWTLPTGILWFSSLIIIVGASFIF